MSFKMECHSKWDVTQDGISPKKVMSLKMEYHLKIIDSQNGKSLKMNFH